LQRAAAASNISTRSSTVVSVSAAHNFSMSTRTPRCHTLVRESVIEAGTDSRKYSVLSENTRVLREPCASSCASDFGAPGGAGEHTSIVQRSLACFVCQFFRSETIHSGFCMILEVSGIGSLEIGVLQVWIQNFQALEGALRKPCAIVCR
jgi:hypothetical protein